MPLAITFGAAAARAIGFTGRTKKKVTQTFTASTTWVVPAGVAKLDTLTGKGADGSPASTNTLWYMNKYRRTVRHYANGGINMTGPERIERNLSYDGAPVPADYCDASNSGDDGSGPIQVGGVWYAMTSWEYCYSYDLTSNTFTNEATTGASASGFGKTFPGGVGGPASLTSFTDVAVTQLASYQLTVPVGGSITITYYQ